MLPVICSTLDVLMLHQGVTSAMHENTRETIRQIAGIQFFETFIFPLPSRSLSDFFYKCFAMVLIVKMVTSKEELSMIKMAGHHLPLAQIDKRWLFRSTDVSNILGAASVESAA